jgi:MFS family permease
VSAYAAMVYYLPREKVGWGLGIMTVSAALGVLLGPVAGGLIINYLDWRWVFLINIPIGILGAFFSQKIIPRADNAKKLILKDVDFGGFIFSALALFLLLYALNMHDEQGGGFSTRTLACLAFSGLFFTVFYFIEKRVSHPLIDIKLLKNRDFALVIFSTIIGFFLFFGGSFLIPFYLTEKGFRPNQIGFILTVFSLVYMPIGLFSGSLSDKVSPRKLVIWAMFFAAVTGFVFSGLLGHYGVWAAVIYLVMLAVAYGFFFSPINHYIMNFADADNRGGVSALYNVALNVSMAMGVVLLEAVFSEFSLPAKGFQVAFLVGGACCLAAFCVLSFLVRDEA